MANKRYLKESLIIPIIWFLVIFVLWLIYRDRLLSVFSWKFIILMAGILFVVYFLGLKLGAMSKSSEEKTKKIAEIIIGIISIGAIIFFVGYTILTLLRNY